MEIEFVNHASVLIRHGEIGLLTDPWYSGPAFHKGWNLLVETDDAVVGQLLERVTHIWLSHEHPDHFSVPFYKRFGQVLRDRNIPVLFQKIDDRRVYDFLRHEGIEVQELDFKKPVDLASDLQVTCLKDEFYDSCLSIRAGDTHILNLNDCAVGTAERAQEIRRTTGPCDILLTQFSYAAWKGGPENRAWRETAAEQKMSNIAVQIAEFEPKFVIPFASFVYFSNTQNVYLNDAVNTPRDVDARFSGGQSAIVTMQPGDTFDGQIDAAKVAAALDYWDAVYAGISEKPLLQFTTRPLEDLETAFADYTARVFRNNNRAAMRLAQIASPIRVFQPVVVHLDDLDIALKIDVPRGEMKKTEVSPDLSMHSESLWFLFKNSFGFDTLTVNGCLEERAPGGFAKAAKSLAVENLNNLGIPFGPGLVLHGKVIAVFLQRLLAVRKRLRPQDA